MYPSDLRDHELEVSAFTRSKRSRLDLLQI